MKSKKGKQNFYWTKLKFMRHFDHKMILNLFLCKRGRIHNEKSPFLKKKEMAIETLYETETAEY